MSNDIQENVIKSAVEAALHDIVDPFTQDALTANRGLQSIELNGNQLNINLLKGYPTQLVESRLKEMVHDSLSGAAFEGMNVKVHVSQKISSHAVQQGVKTIEGVKNIIAVASGKGGVGKSTVSANLSLALAQAGAQVAVLDADIYGPSQPRMLGVSGRPDALDDKRLLPLCNHSLKIMSIGFLVEEDTPMIWRGPMVTQALEQMLRGTAWAEDGYEVDYLIIDLPPGTGDIQLTLSQKVPVTGAVIVTTPQDIALLDARKAVKMFEKVDIPIVGVIENMSTHVCTQCGHEEAIFGADGAKQMAEEYGLQLLGDIPLQMSVRELADSGSPTVVAQPDSNTAKKYVDIAMQIAGQLASKKQNFSSKFPNIVVQNS